MLCGQCLSTSASQATATDNSPSVIILDVLNGSASGDTEINDNSDLYLGQFHKSKSAVIPASELENVPMTAA